MVKSRKARSAGKKRKWYHISKARRKQLVALFLVLLMIGSALVLIVSY